MESQVIGDFVEQFTCCMRNAKNKDQSYKIYTFVRVSSRFLNKIVKIAFQTIYKMTNCQ